MNFQVHDIELGWDQGLGHIAGASSIEQTVAAFSKLRNLVAQQPCKGTIV